VGAGVRRGRGGVVSGRGRGRGGGGGAFVFFVPFRVGHSTYGVNSSILVFFSPPGYQTAIVLNKNPNPQRE
jgi:hypothetical protein